MILPELLPILILLGISLSAIAIAFILKIRAKRSLLSKKDSDFIDELISRKKKQLSTGVAGVTWSTYLLLLTICPTGAATICCFIADNKAFCVVCAFLGLFIPELIVRVLTYQHKKKFEEMYAMALRALASSLRSGLSLEQSIDNVGRNPFIETTIRDGFKQIAADIKFGIPIDEAFVKFAKDCGSKDAMDVASVISMQSKVGGSEAAVITTIVQNINDRIMMRNEIKALFADTDMLILAMDFMPFVLLGILYFGAYEMIAPFFEDTAMTMLLIGLLIFTCIGSIVIHKISSSAKGG